MRRHGSGMKAVWGMALAATCAIGAPLAKDETPTQAQIPVCDKKIGVLSVQEPETQWWTQYGLESPAALIKVFVSESKCFTLVDRGKGLAAAEKERALSSNGEMRGGSNVGKGQMKAADYALIPDLVSRNAHAGGKHIGGMLGGLIGGGAGAVLGGINTKSKTADVVLTMTDLRSTEQVALAEGHAKKTNIGWSAGGGGFSSGAFASGGASSYSNTEIGQVITMAYLDAYIKLVNEVKSAPPDAKADNVQQSVTMAKPGRMYIKPDNKTEVVRDLDSGMMLYPSGDKQGIWWKVSDELGNEGWVPSTLFDLAK